MFMRMIYDEKLAQAAYLFGCQRSGEAIVIDPERDVDRYIALARQNGLRIVAVAETHIHADFVSGARELAEQVGAKVYVSGMGGPDWTTQWLDKKTGGGTYDHRVLRDGDVFSIGAIEFKVLYTPGHTPEHVAYLVTDRGGGASEPVGMVTGDFVFVGDIGRPDLLETAAGHAGAMEPSARQLYRTTKKLDTVADFVQVWPGHGAGSACGKALGAVPMSTIGYEKRFNPGLRAADNERHFVDYILSGQPEPPVYFATMKRVNKEGPRVLGSLPLPARMNVDDLARIDSRRSAIVDLRSWESFCLGHVRGALSIPLKKAFPTDAGSFVHEEEDIVLIAPPAQVEEAVRDLVRVGLDKVIGWFDASQMEQYQCAGHAMTKVREVTPREAEAMLEDANTAVLDVRRATEFVEGHIPAATNIAHTRLAVRMGDVPKGKRLVVNCRSGVRSARSCAYLQRAGYDVVNLKGGFLAWEAAHAAVER